MALQGSYSVTGYSLGGVPKELLEAGLVEVAAIAGFRDALKRPRVIMLYIPAGPDVDKSIDSLTEVLEPGDIILDGGNSYWGDSIRRHDRLKAAGIQFVDLGTSGGVSGAREGACFMAGGGDLVVAEIVRNSIIRVVECAPPQRFPGPE